MTIVGMNLQLFAGEKTEKPTLKKRRDARERGQVFRSVEINSAIVLLAGFTMLKIAIPGIIDNLKKVYISFLGGSIILDQVFSYEGLRKLSIDLGWSLVITIAPFMLVTLVVGLIANYVQVGFLFTTKTIVPKLNRINPLEGFKRIFSKRALVDFLKSIIKLVIIGSVVYTELKSGFSQINRWFIVDLWQGIPLIGNNAYTIALKISIILLILAILDYGYQWWQYEIDLKMTKQEVKDEYKLMEGDPQIRSRIRGKQRELGMQRMMQAIPKADVVITNPTHYAVALSYDPDKDDAPIVVAKGQGFLALRIKEVASRNNVVITENKPLAQALYRSTDVGQSIPSELFHAVAEVLAFVYDLKGKTI